MTDPTELDELLPEPRRLKIRDRTLVLRPIRFGQLPQVLRLARPVLKELPTAAAGDVTVDVIGLLGTHGEELLELCGVLTDTDRAWLDELELDEAAALVAELVDVNRDFFVRRMGPTLARLVRSVLSPTTGKSSSPAAPRNGTPRPDFPGPTPPSG